VGALAFSLSCVSLGGQAITSSVTAIVQ
jgi:hypothetical protein